MKINSNPMMVQQVKTGTMPQKRKRVQNNNNKMSFMTRSSRYANEIESEGISVLKRIGKTIAIAVPVILGCVAGCDSFKVIEPGERGTGVVLGKVKDDVYTEGLHAKWPFIEQIVTTDVKTKKIQDSTEVYTKDIQQATVKYAVNYNVQPEQVNKLYQHVGSDYKTTIIQPAIEGGIKDVVGNWNAQDLIGNRTKAANEIKTILQEKLKDNYINVTGVELTNINYSNEFEKAIEEKVTAQQQALKAQNKTIQVEEEAKQKVIAAKGEAEAIEIKAAALAKNPTLIQYEYAQAFKDKWNGQLPYCNLGGNSATMVNISDMLPNVPQK